MGDPRKLRKKYTPPRHPWEKDRIESENKLVKDFGLRNKKEIWRADATIRKFRYLARGLVGIPVNQRKGEEEKLLGKLQKLGLLKEGCTLDDALSMKVEDLLARRLQTLIWRNAIAGTLTQARQLVTHGHIAVNSRRVSSPGMIIDIENEKLIGWYGKPVEIMKKADAIPAVEAVKEKPKEEKKKPVRKRAPKKKAEAAEEIAVEVDSDAG